MAKMRAGREDRRVIYTKHAIKDALLELMKEKSFEKLSISGVCEAAQITRTTFYSHYDTLNQVLDELIDEAFEVAEYSSTTLSMTMPSGCTICSNLIQWRRFGSITATCLLVSGLQICPNTGSSFRIGLSQSTSKTNFSA